VVIAGTWEVYLQTHILESGGVGSGIYVSRDAGKTFSNVGVERGAWRKGDIAETVGRAEAGQRIYGFREDDGGGHLSVY
jgi:hypothetical protein